jgi:hypothetical protein
MYIIFLFLFKKSQGPGDMGATAAVIYMYIIFLFLFKKSQGPGDMGATATVDIDTSVDVDAQAIFEKSQQINKVTHKA